MTCAVAMVMGHPYCYERVRSESDKYTKVSVEGKFLAWWERYFRDEGFQIAYRPFADLYNLPNVGGSIVGLLGMDFRHLRRSHIVAVDELGIIDPADNSPAHISIESYVLSRIEDGAVSTVSFWRSVFSTQTLQDNVGSL